MADGVDGPDLVARLVSATAGRRHPSGLTGLVAFGIGSKPVTLVFEGGQVLGATDAEPHAVLALTKKQFEAWGSGELSLSVAYMQGDVKPEGSTGALLAALEVLDDPEVRAALA